VVKGQLGTLARLQGELEKAEKYYCDILKIFQQLGEPKHEAITWHELGLVYQKLE